MGLTQPALSNVVSLAPPKKQKRKRPIAGRGKLFARGAAFRPFQESDYAILWAAYMRGAFEDAPKGLNAAQLRDGLAPFLSGAIVHVMNAPNPETKEVGIVASLPSQGGYLLSPRVVWFPWSTSRNRLECSVKWLNEARKTAMPVMHLRWDGKTEAGADPFAKHLCRYGVLRPIGVEHHYPSPGETSWAYQGVRLEG